MVRVRAIFRIPTIRELYAKIRFNLFIRFRGLDASTDVDYIKKREYSQQAFQRYVSIPERINFLVSAVETSRRAEKADTLLSLGPRFESELFGYRAIGYSRDRIHALDSFSYSRLISLGNMHSLNYSDCSFDIVVGGWILAYSASPIVAIREIFRVTKEGGLALLTWDLPIELDNNSKDLEDLFLPSVNGAITATTDLIQGWNLHFFAVGNVAWSSDRRIVLIALKKPSINIF